MSLTGTLKTWKVDRGFGFIAPAHGGRELFVHISAFPRDGFRPTVGESLVYELGRGKDGKPQAVRVYRQGLGKPTTYPRSRPNRKEPRYSPFAPIIGLVLMIAAGTYGYSKYQQHFQATQLQAPMQEGAIRAFSTPEQSPYRCDGRIHCSQMTSCREATFFLQNCPGTQMDGDRDGVPCEQQWCTSIFAR